MLVATQPVVAPGAVVVTQPVMAPSIGVSTQLVNAPSARPVIPADTQPVGFSGALPVFPPVRVKLPKILLVPLKHHMAVHSQAQDSDMHQDIEPTSPTWATDEEGEASDRESAKPENCDQEVSEEQKYPETIGNVSSFMWWKQFPELESILEDNPFVGTRT